MYKTNMINTKTTELQLSDLVKSYTETDELTVSATATFPSYPLRYITD